MKQIDLRNYQHVHFVIIVTFNALFIILLYEEESDHSNKAVRKTPEIESGHKVSELSLIHI